MFLYCQTVLFEVAPSEFIQYLHPLSGPLVGYPLLGVSTLIQSINVEPGTSAAMVSACVSRCMLKVTHHSFFYHKRKRQDYRWVNGCSGRSHAGHETSRKSGAGATDVAGGDCRGGAPRRRAGGLGSEARNRPRHPESSWQQGAACECAPGWDDGEWTHDSNMLSVAFRDALIWKFWTKITMWQRAVLFVLVVNAWKAFLHAIQLYDQDFCSSAVAFRFTLQLFIIQIHFCPFFFFL